MRLNSSQLEAFYTVAKTLNFTKAAVILNVTQSALSQRIAKLEEELGTTLFIRDRTSIRLTEAGQKLLRFCQMNDAAESEFLALLQDSKTDYAGTLRIGGFSSVNRSIVVPALKNLMTKNPRLSIQLLTKELSDLPGLLKSAEADYIITNIKSDSPDIESVFLGIEENVLVKLKKAQDSEIYLDHDERDPSTKSYFSQNKMSFKPTGMRYLDDVYGLIDGVKNGYGKAVLPLHLIENDPTLEVIELKKTLKVQVYLQYFIQPFYRRVHSVVVDELESYFQKILRQEK